MIQQDIGVDYGYNDCVFFGGYFLGLGQIDQWIVLLLGILWVVGNYKGFVDVIGFGNQDIVMFV